MKKYGSILLSILLLLSLCACTASAETIQITFWHSMSDNAGVLMEKYIEE